MELYNVQRFNKQALNTPIDLNMDIPHVMQLLVIVRTQNTSSHVIIDLLDIGKKIKKTPIVVRNYTGFTINRTLFPSTQAALLLVEYGADIYCIDRAFAKFGMAMSFFRSLSWPLCKLNRLCSGQVLASGEELPFGIATCAFDGTRMSKWEEPNGAEGCWIIYQVAGNQMVELVAYQLMSANDAPERYPKDWYDILAKYSCDEILSILQATYVFPAFETDIAISVQEGWFRFLAVRDKNANSRFQIGSIDLYTELRESKVQEFINFMQGKISVKEYSLKFTKLARYAPNVVSDDWTRMSKFVSSIADSMVKECRTAMLIKEIDLSMLMDHAYQIEEKKFK
ncbi:Glyoxysomal fatty acid beta-oxidation multifunctional protein MFP-a [Capsicum baccatum]|uniref:Glyoxysomal fatty acid beta-oxidation multifunctional protein MFP-a n=1 Tax=Capsicum baccatum TaxID=33114 RepID=A0A2G2W5G0_CAPBA|nr:Glyoxysomal fatty acid beta-oxidation multifunctional protein MFP-a [Capsicum baccatum]